MKFEFNCEQVTKADKTGFSKLHSEVIDTLPKKSKEYIETLINNMGEASAKAQKLPSAITSFKRLQMNLDKQKLFIYSQKKQWFGFLKIGYKKLFVSTEYGDVKEINPLWVLDFYVTEDVQRQGIGKRLFDLMLSDTKNVPEKIAYDRPSDKLLKFLSKHFGLKRYLPQNNNFVVFSQYFNPASSSKHAFNKKSQNKEDHQEETKFKGIYESTPSYKVTYKRGKAPLKASENVVSRDYINSLICTQDSNDQWKRVAANDESKDGLKLSNHYEGSPTHSMFDQKNNKENTFRIQNGMFVKANFFLDPILSAYGDLKPKLEVTSVLKEEEKMSLSEIERKLREKEAELQEVMEKMSVSSKASYQDVAKSALMAGKSSIFSHEDSDYQAPPKIISVLATSQVEDNAPCHGHPSFSDYNSNNKVYSAQGMRKMQFHSGAPWATGD